MADLDFIDSGVAEIAEGMGFDTDTREIETETIDDDTQEVSDEPEEIESESTDDQEQVEEVEEETQPTVKEQPKSWAKDKAELWAKTPDDVKEYIEQRESQMLEGINQYRDGYKYGEYIAQAIEPYRAEIEAGGGDEATAIMNLFEHHKAITQGSLEQRQQAFIKIGIATGLIPQEGQAQPDPKVSALEQRIAAFERQQAQAQQRQQQQTAAQVQKQVEDFAKDKPDFDMLADEIALLLQKGYDLDKAYAEAKWMNPTVRQKEIDRMTQERAKAKQDEALKAKKAASVNIKSVQTNSRPSQPKGRLFDDLGDVLSDIRARQ